MSDWYRYSDTNQTFMMGVHRMTVTLFPLVTPAL